MTKIDHTPTPWLIHSDNNPFTIIANIDGLFRFETVADCDVNSASPLTVDDCKANAAFIVKACNSHEEILAVLQELYDAVGNIRAEQAAKLGLVLPHSKAGNTLARMAT